MIAMTTIMIAVDAFPGMTEDGCHFKCVAALMPFPVTEERPLPKIEGCTCLEEKRFLIQTKFQLHGTGYAHSYCPHAHKWAHLDEKDEL
jgi:hypothetical protein